MKYLYSTTKVRFLLLFFLFFLISNTGYVMADDILEMVVPVIANSTVTNIHSKGITYLKATARIIDGKTNSKIVANTGKKILTCDLTSSEITIYAPSYPSPKVISLNSINKSLPSKQTANNLCVFIAGQLLGEGQKAQSIERNFPGCDVIPDLPCMLKCCSAHDKCFNDYYCDIFSWFQDDGADPFCQECNENVVQCSFLSCEYGQEPQIANCYDERCNKFFNCNGENCDCISPCDRTCTFSFNPSNNGYSATCHESILGFNLRIHYFESNDRYEIKIYQISNNLTKFVSLIQLSKPYYNWAFALNEPWTHARTPGEEHFLSTSMCGDSESATRIGIYLQDVNNGENMGLHETILELCDNNPLYNFLVEDAYKEAVNKLRSTVFLRLDNRIFPGSCKNWYQEMGPNNFPVVCNH